MCSSDLPLPAPDDNDELEVDVAMGSLLFGLIPLPGSGKKQLSSGVWLYSSGLLHLPFESEDGAIYGLLVTESALEPTEGGMTWVRVGIDP